MEIILSNKNKFELSLTVASTLGGLTLTALIGQDLQNYFFAYILQKNIV
jgi:hypothetical protein